MVVSTHAIVLSKLRYRDNDLIVKCYTEHYGILGFLLRGVLKSKKGLTKTAYFELLSQLELVIVYHPNRSLHTIKEAKLNYVYSSLHSNVLKSSVVMFLAEILSNTLKEEEQNNALFGYIETTLLWLDAHTECANFHLLFLLKLTKYLGFYPENMPLEHQYFSLQDGKFETNPSGKHTVSGDNFNLLKQLLNTKFDTLSQLNIKDVFS